MPQLKPNWDDVPPRNWEEEQAYRVATEIRRLRGKRSAQWLANRTEECGSAVSRTVISDLENGRRRYVTTAELVVLAIALNTAPIALMYPASYWEKIQVFPTAASNEPLEVAKIWAVQWFSGLLPTITDVPFDDGGQILAMDLTTAMNYDANVKALERARKAFQLDQLRSRKAHDLRRIRHRKDNGEDVADEVIAELVADIADLQRQIDGLRELGGRDLNAEAFEWLTNRRGDGNGHGG
ncbi:hypothetical protein [Mycobacterium paraintracellulare]|uniref:hypothetical protein n=1 Tax=Mycobacterium paraintracellulare TaxID=1138383 RepID=UPI0019251A70|nr:hypothetical protein [Mycobacterium paraintracellulare]BCP14857.1 hypothetical protein MINTM021_17660 [Mycobacterium paraintracellulare]